MNPPALQSIFGRRSIRIFKPGKVGEQTITKLLEAAMAAPSAAAKDPWRFVAVQKPETMADLATVLSNGVMLKTAAPCIAAVLMWKRHMTGSQAMHCRTVPRP